MELIEIKTNKKAHLDLLLLADEQESMIDRYLERGTMYALNDGGIKAVCVVTDEGDSVLEIKNLAVAPEWQHQGYGKKMIRALEDIYKDRFRTVRVGTGDSPLTVPFYEKCGFHEACRMPHFFTDNYDHPIFEAGIQLVDMVVLEKSLQSS